MVLFVDWDGTLARFGTETPNPGAIETIFKVLEVGHQVIITTARTDLFGIKQLLRNVGLEDLTVLGGVQNPRVVINDDGALAINHDRDAPWNYDDLLTLPVQEIY